MEPRIQELWNLMVAKGGYLGSVEALEERIQQGRAGNIIKTAIDSGIVKNEADFNSRFLGEVKKKDGGNGLKPISSTPTPAPTVGNVFGWETGGNVYIPNQETLSRAESILFGSTITKKKEKGAKLLPKEGGDPLAYKAAKEALAAPVVDVTKGVKAEQDRPLEPQNPININTGREITKKVNEDINTLAAAFEETEYGLETKYADDYKRLGDSISEFNKTIENIKSLGGPTKAYEATLDNEEVKAVLSSKKAVEEALGVAKGKIEIRRGIEADIEKLNQNFSNGSIQEDAYVKKFSALKSEYDKIDSELKESEAMVDEYNVRFNEVDQRFSIQKKYAGAKKEETTLRELYDKANKIAERVSTITNDPAFKKLREYQNGIGEQSRGYAKFLEDNPNIKEHFLSVEARQKEADSFYEKPSAASLSLGSFSLMRGAAMKIIHGINFAVAGSIETVIKGAFPSIPFGVFSMAKFLSDENDAFKEKYPATTISKMGVRETVAGLEDGNFAVFGENGKIKHIRDAKGNISPARLTRGDVLLISKLPKKAVYNAQSVIRQSLDVIADVAVLAASVYLTRGAGGFAGRPALVTSITAQTMPDYYRLYKGLGMNDEVAFANALGTSLSIGLINSFTGIEGSLIGKNILLDMAKKYGVAGAYGSVGKVASTVTGEYIQELGLEKILAEAPGLALARLATGDRTISINPWGGKDKVISEGALIGIASLFYGSVNAIAGGKTPDFLDIANIMTAGYDAEAVMGKLAQQFEAGKITKEGYDASEAALKELTDIKMALPEGMRDDIMAVSIFRKIAEIDNKIIAKKGEAAIITEGLRQGRLDSIKKLEAEKEKLFVALKEKHEKYELEEKKGDAIIAIRESVSEIEAIRDVENKVDTKALSVLIYNSIEETLKGFDISKNEKIIAFSDKVANIKQKLFDGEIDELASIGKIGDATKALMDDITGGAKELKSSPKRDEFFNKIGERLITGGKISKFLGAAKLDTYRAMMDAAANRWAKRTGRSSDEFYEEYIEDVKLVSSIEEMSAETGQEFGDIDTPKAAIHFMPSKKAVLFLFKEADISSLAHESAHLFRRVMYDSAQIATGASLEAITGEIKTIEKWLGVESSSWTVEQEEKFARGFERYLKDGTSISEELSKIFENLKKWLSDIYKDIKDIDINIPEEVKGVYDSIFLGQDVYGGKTIKEGGIKVDSKFSPSQLSETLQKEFKKERDRLFDEEGITDIDNQEIVDKVIEGKDVEFIPVYRNPGGEEVGFFHLKGDPHDYPGLGHSLDSAKEALARDTKNVFLKAPDTLFQAGGAKAAMTAFGQRLMDSADIDPVQKAKLRDMGIFYTTVGSNLINSEANKIVDDALSQYGLRSGIDYLMKLAPELRQLGLENIDKGLNTITIGNKKVVMSGVEGPISIGIYVKAAYKAQVAGLIDLAAEIRSKQKNIGTEAGQVVSFFSEDMFPEALANKTNESIREMVKDMLGQDIKGRKLSDVLDELRGDLSNIRDEIQNELDKKAATSNDIDDAINRLNDLDNDIKAAEEELTELKKDAEANRDLISELKKEIEALKKEKEDLSAAPAIKDQIKEVADEWFKEENPADTLKDRLIDRLGLSEDEAADLEKTLLKAKKEADTKQTIRDIIKKHFAEKEPTGALWEKIIDGAGVSERRARKEAIDAENRIKELVANKVKREIKKLADNYKGGKLPNNRVIEKLTALIMGGADITDAEMVHNLAVYLGLPSITAEEMEEINEIATLMLNDVFIKETETAIAYEGAVDLAKKQWDILNDAGIAPSGNKNKWIKTEATRILDDKITTVVVPVNSKIRAGLANKRISLLLAKIANNNKSLLKAFSNNFSALMHFGALSSISTPFNIVIGSASVLFPAIASAFAAKPMVAVRAFSKMMGSAPGWKAGLAAANLAFKDSFSPLDSPESFIQGKYGTHPSSVEYSILNGMVTHWNRRSIGTPGERAINALHYLKAFMMQPYRIAFMPRVIDAMLTYPILESLRFLELFNEANGGVSNMLNLTSGAKAAIASAEGVGAFGHAAWDGAKRQAFAEEAILVKAAEDKGKQAEEDKDNGMKAAKTKEDKDTVMSKYAADRRAVRMMMPPKGFSNLRTYEIVYERLDSKHIRSALDGVNSMLLKSSAPGALGMASSFVSRNINVPQVEDGVLKMLLQSVTHGLFMFANVATHGINYMWKTTPLLGLPVNSAISAFSTRNAINEKGAKEWTFFAKYVGEDAAKKYDKSRRLDADIDPNYASGWVKKGYMEAVSDIGLSAMSLAAMVMLFVDMFDYDEDEEGNVTMKLSENRHFDVTARLDKSGRFNVGGAKRYSIALRLDSSKPFTPDMYGKYILALPFAVTLASIGDMRDRHTFGDEEAKYRNLLGSYSKTMGSIIGALSEVSFNSLFRTVKRVEVAGKRGEMSDNLTQEYRQELGNFVIDAYKTMIPAAYGRDATSTYKEILTGDPSSMPSGYTFEQRLTKDVPLLEWYNNGMKIDEFGNPIYRDNKVKKYFGFALKHFGDFRQENERVLDHPEWKLAMRYPGIQTGGFYWTSVALQRLDSQRLITAEEREQMSIEVAQLKGFIMRDLINNTGYVKPGGILDTQGGITDLFENVHNYAVNTVKQHYNFYNSSQEARIAIAKAFSTGNKTEEVNNDTGIGDPEEKIKVINLPQEMGVEASVYSITSKQMAIYTNLYKDEARIRPFLKRYKREEVVKKFEDKARSIRHSKNNK